MTTASKDLDEAQAILRTLAERQLGWTGDAIIAKADAAKRLFEEFVALNGYAGAKIVHDANQRVVTVQLGNASAFVAYAMEPSEFSAYGATRKETKPSLSYNVETKVWEGTDDDTFRTPIAGEPRKKRSAIAVLLAAIVADFPKPTKFPM